MSLSFDVLRNRDFRLLLVGRTLATMAMQAQAVIVGWQVYSLTHDPFILGLTGLAEAVPAIACALYAGHVTDIHRPFRVFQLCVAALMANMLMLLLVAGGIVPAAGSLVGWIFAGVFISGLARSFIIPAAFALQLQIVPPAQVAAAAAWRSSCFQLGIVAGPALAGLVYGGYGARAAWLLPVSLMAIALALVSAIGREHHHFRHEGPREPAWQSMRSGARFIRRHPILLPVMALDMFAVLFGGATAMLPAYADQVLHAGSQGLGALRAAPALGAVVTALLLAIRPLRVLRGSVLLLAVSGFGVCMIGFGLSTHFWLSMFFLAAGGAFDSISVVIRSTLAQLLTPGTMRGRVSAVQSMFIISSNEIGAFESGLAARLLGLVPSVVLGGVGSLLVVAATALASPRFRRLAVETDKAA